MALTRPMVITVLNLVVGIRYSGVGAPIKFVPPTITLGTFILLSIVLY